MGKGWRRAVAGVALGWMAAALPERGSAQGTAPAAGAKPAPAVVVRQIPISARMNGKKP